MSAKRELLLREKEFLTKRVEEVQREHADAMSHLRAVEHAHCVTEMEVERRATMMLQKQSEECDEIRHALDVFDEINYADEQRLGMAHRDLTHAKALLVEEREYTRDFWHDIVNLINEVHLESTKYRAAARKEPSEMEGLQADLRSAKFLTQGVKSNASRYMNCCIAETYEKERFEQHLFTQAIDKLRNLEEDRGRMIKGFMRNSEAKADELHKAQTEAEREAQVPSLHAVVTSEKEPSFAERARRLADQRYGTEDLLIKQAEQREENVIYADASIKPQQTEYEEDNNREVQDEANDGEEPRPSPGRNDRDTASPPPILKKQSTASSAPPSLTWHGRRVGIRHVDPV